MDDAKNRRIHSLIQEDDDFVQNEGVGANS